MRFHVASTVRSTALRSRVLGLAKTFLFDGVQVWAVGWQEQQRGPRFTNGVARCRGFVAAEIIHDNDVAGRQGRHQHLVDVGRKISAVDRPVEDAAGVDAV